MRRVLRLALLTVVALAILTVGAWVFREPLLNAVGISFDRGEAGETSIEVPEGFEVEVFASGLERPRFMATSPDGVLFVADLGTNRVLALPDADGDGRADETIVVGEDYDRAHSLAFTDDGSLLVAGSSTLFRLSLDEDLQELSRESILSYPGGGAHMTRSVVVAADGSLLLSVGSTCNVCWEDDEERATVLRANADGGEARVYMRGLRNAVGVSLDPATGAAWVTNNGRDMMGDDVPPETLYRLTDGTDAGWPRCHSGDIVDPDLGDQPDPWSGLVGCDGVVAPAAQFQAHAAPLGLAFWRDHAVIAFHGSWNRREKVGYDVQWLPWDDGPAGDAEVLASGFLDPASGDATGRPAGVIVGADEALYISDDKGGFIYRVSARD
jgi:glucose/arabinose dehydrogenase